jgi:phage-related protein (TIGR01555 family)
MFNFFRSKPTDIAVASKQTITERLKGFFGHSRDSDEDPPLSRAQLIHQTMMAIQAAAVARLPRMNDKLPEGFAMDGFGVDGEQFSASFAAQPNMSDGVILWYAQQSFIAHQMCAIVATHWLVNKACSQMPRDAMRKGYKIIADDGNELDPKDVKFIERYDRAFDIKKHCVQFIRKGRIFGIRIAMFRVDSPDPYYYEKPFNINGVLPGAYKGIVQVDPYWTAPMLDAQATSNPMSPHFYEPTYWLINGKKIHRSHLVVYINDEVMDFLKPSYIYGGVPLPQQIMERVYAAERTANEGPMLAMSKRTTVMKVNAAEVLANKRQFDENMNWWIAMRDNYQVKVIDKDNEDIEQLDTALGDLDKIIMNQYQLVSAIARTPSTKLLGTQPTGFNSSGDYETDSYHEECESTQEDMRPLMDRHHALVVQSHLRKPIRVAVAFNPVDAPKESERAETNLKKAQTYQILKDTGAIDGADINEALRSDSTMGLTGITPAIRDVGEDNVDDEGNPVRTIENSPAPSEMFGVGSSDGPDSSSGPSGFESED